MEEYVMLLLKEKTVSFIAHDPWLIDYCLNYTYKTRYDDVFYQEWFERLDGYDSYLYARFHGRSDYRYQDHFHYLYNEMTKEISIMIINPYQINLKCDRISNVLVQTLRESNHLFRIFRHDKCYEEVLI